MIFPDKNAKGSSKVPQDSSSSSNQNPDASSAAPPPAYHVAEYPQQYQYQYPASHPQYTQSQSSPLLNGNGNGAPSPAGPSPPRESPRMRFFKAFLVALVIYFLTGALIASIVDNTSIHGSGSWGRPESPTPSEGIILNDNDCAPDASDFFSAGAVDTQMQRAHIPFDYDDAQSRWGIPNPIYQDPWGSTPPSILKSRYSIPISDLTDFFILAKGNHAYGQVRYQEARSTSQDKVVVDVDMMYWDDDVLDSVRLCKLTRSEGHRGFGIFTPRQEWRWVPGHRRSVRFDVVITIPVGAKSKVAGLSSFIPNFAQYLAGFENHVWTSGLELQGTNNIILAYDTVKAEPLALRTTNGAIRGRFSSEKKLTIQTTNAAIDAEIELSNAVRDGRSLDPSEATLLTTNGRLNASFALSAHQDDRFTASDSEFITKKATAGGKFALVLHTTNSPLQITIPAAPLNSTISLTGTTTNSYASTTLPRTFEGSFELRTTNGKQNVAVNLRREDDPSGLRRQPSLESSVRDRTGRVVQGAFWWGEPRPSKEREGWGSVGVTTTNGRNDLTIR